MLQWPFPQTLVMHGNLTIKRWDPQRDQEGLWQALQAPEVWEFNPLGAPCDAEDLSHRLESQPDGPERLIWTIFLDGEPVGTSSHFRAGEAVEIGASYLAPNTWGTGLNVRVKRMMVSLARNSDVSGIIFHADDQDERSNRAILKLGADFMHKSAASLSQPDGTRRITRSYRLENDVCL